jgi:hypothetical protein
VGSYALYNATAEFVVGGGADTVQSGIITQFHSLKNVSGVVVSELDWTTIPVGTTSVPDGDGNTFTLTGDAYFSPGWNTVTVDSIGPRVGFLNTSNYIPDSAWPTPCYQDDPLVMSKRDAANGKGLIRHVYINNGLATIHEQISSDHWLMRPINPLNASAIRTIVTEFTHYGSNDYTTYKGNQIALGR